ncbi:MAG: HU family DNA-binding protein [Dysgonomonas sp.]
MNKKETIEKVSQISQVSISDCEKVLDAFETVLSNELEDSKGIRSFFDKVYKLMSILKNQ